MDLRQTQLLEEQREERARLAAEQGAALAALRTQLEALQAQLADLRSQHARERQELATAHTSASSELARALRPEREARSAKTVEDYKEAARRRAQAKAELDEESRRQYLAGLSAPPAPKRV